MITSIVVRAALLALVASFVVAACFGPTEEPTTCEHDPSLCATFPKEAKRVVCSCSCEFRVSLTRVRKFEGSFDACLPPELNVATASESQRVALMAMSPERHGQAVYAVCSERVATFLEALVGAQVDARSPLCLSRPVACSCQPVRAWTHSTICEKPCRDVACDRDTCFPVARSDGTLDHNACWCSRIRSCGQSVPALDEPPLCRAEIRPRTLSD